MAPSEEPGSLAQTEIFGRFVLLEQLDASGGAETCRAVDLERELQPLVTVRRLPRWGSFAPQERAAFKLAAGLRSKARATLLASHVDSGELNGVPYWATEFVPGVSIDRVLERAINGGGLSLHTTFTVAYCMAAVALDLSADQLDRSAESVLVAPLIHPRRVILTWSGRPFFLGTSYEQAKPDDEERRYTSRGGRARPEADAASLAALVFEMCTGLPFSGGGSVDGEGPLGRVPQEARDALRRALALEMKTPRDLLHVFETLMKAAGGGLFADVARELGGMFADEQQQESAQIEHDSKLARRFRRRLTAKGSRDGADAVVRVRPASQEGLALGDPLEKKKPPKDDMVLVKGGRFLFGTQDEPSRYIDVAPFLADRHPVTCEDWLRFIEATGTQKPLAWGGRFPLEDADHPVVGLDAVSIAAYARWVGKRLPDEVEWELMARGFDGRLWPWGDTFEADCLGPFWRLPLRQRFTERVGARSPRGDSPFGVADLCQSWEWTSTPHSDGGFVVRGGPWRNRTEPPMLTNRSREEHLARDVTFRLVKSVADLDDKTEV